MRFWKEDKLLFISIVVAAGCLLYTVPSTVELYHTEGARILFYPVGMAYVLVSLIQEARARVVPDELSAIMAKAKVLEKTDPAAALDLLDSFFVARHEAATQQRALLWESASHDRRAAATLERLLKDELRGHDLMRRRGLAAAPPEQQAVGLEMVEKAERRTREDLERVRAMLKQLKP
jgi:hypothetical protein